MASASGLHQTRNTVTSRTGKEGPWKHDTRFACNKIRYLDDNNPFELAKGARTKAVVSMI